MRCIPDQRTAAHQCPAKFLYATRPGADCHKIAPYVWREVVLSSRIEGTRADLSDLWLDDIDGGEKRPQTADVQERKSLKRSGTTPVRLEKSAIERGDE